MVVFAEHRAWPQSAVGSDARAFAHHRLLDVAHRQDLGAGFDLRILDHAVGTDAHPVAEHHLAFEDAVHIDEAVATDAQLAAHIEACGISQTDTGIEQGLCDLSLIDALEFGELRLAVDAEGLVHRCGLRTDHRHALGDRHRDDIGEVILFLCVVIGQRGKPAFERGGGRHQNAGIDLPDAPDGVVGILVFDDAQNRTAIGELAGLRGRVAAIAAAGQSANDTTVAARVGQIDGEQGELVLTCSLNQPRECGRCGQWHIAIKHHGWNRLIEQRDRLHHRVSGTKLRRLLRPGDIG